MFTFTEVILSIFSITILIFLRHFIKRKKEPPGPIGLPFLGMIPYRLFEFTFSKWIKQEADVEVFKRNKKMYGPIWSSVYGSLRIVTLSSWSLIHEAFIENGELFSGRPTSEGYKIVSNGRGIIFIDGEMWRGNRNLAIKSLKELGMGTKDLEYRVSEEANDVISYLKSMNLENIDLQEIITKGVSNVVIRLVFEERNDYDDDVFKMYVKNLTYFSHSDSVGKKISISPKLFKTAFVRKMCPDVERFFEANDYCFNFIKKKCAAREKSQQENGIPTCVFDYFYKNRFTDDCSLPTEERNAEIVQSMFDLFNAGIDTTSNLLSFCFLMLGKYEQIQGELRNEIKSFVEDFEQINMGLRKNCPKILSFIDEVQRFCSLVPKVHHRVMNKCTFHGYEIYPDDIVFGDLYNLYNDPDLFENPDQFMPYRFTDASRTKYCPSMYLIPFGIGKRSCLGESIATMELFLFLTKIIFNFKITLTKETSQNFDEIIKGHYGIVHGSLDHYLNLEAY